MEKQPAEYMLKTAIAVASVVIFDVIIYGELVPLVALYVGCLLSAALNFPMYMEILVVSGCTMGIFFSVLALRLEKPFWVKLYSMDPFYKYILHARDLLNAISLAAFIGAKVMFPTQVTIKDSDTLITIQTPDSLDYPIQGYGSILCQRLEAYKLGGLWSACAVESSWRARYEVLYEINVLFIAAKVIVSVGKMLYFNTLCTYLQTLKILKEFHTMFHHNQEDNSAVHSRVARRPRRRRHGARETNDTHASLPFGISTNETDVRDAPPRTHILSPPPQLSPTTAAFDETLRD